MMCCSIKYDSDAPMVSKVVNMKRFMQFIKTVLVTRHTRAKLHYLQINDNPNALWLDNLLNINNVNKYECVCFFYI